MQYCDISVNARLYVYNSIIQEFPKFHFLILDHNNLFSVRNWLYLNNILNFFQFWRPIYTCST